MDHMHQTSCPDSGTQLQEEAAVLVCPNMDPSMPASGRKLEGLSH